MSKIKTVIHDAAIASELRFAQSVLADITLTPSDFVAITYAEVKARMPAGTSHQKLCDLGMKTSDAAFELMRQRKDQYMAEMPTAGTA
jgi:hypothetical protein